MKGKTGIQGRILILDDDPLTAQTIDRIARFIGMQAQYTTDHRIFFERLEDWHPDVIALDLVMPDMDGIEVLSVLAEQGCRADIIITSGVEQRVMESARRAADDKGLRILGLLAKPFSTGQLKELLNQHDAAVAERQVTDYVPVQTSESTQFPVLTEDTLTAAIVKRQFCYFYQPKVHCNTGVVCGFEALARWHHPEFGWQSPGRFIPEAESLGMISSLSSHLFAQGISWFAGLREQIASQSITMDFMLDFEQLTLSLNVSALSLAEFSLFTELRALCSQWNINTEQVILEITESCAMDDNERSLQTLTRLRMQGFQLAIDDFGTGYSSMLQLVRMPFSELKIDQSFTMNVSGNAESRAVIRSMVELGKSIGMKVVAEGIEELSSWDFLRQLDCDMVQGFLIARPLPAEQVFSWLLQQVSEVEQHREAEMIQLGIDNPDCQRRFDRITHLTNRLLGIPVVLFSVVDGDRVWVKSATGISDKVFSKRGSFFNEIVRTGLPLSLLDASRDSRFNQHELVEEAGIKGYAGVPLCTPRGFVAGALSVMAAEPFDLDADQRSKLSMLGSMLEKELASQEPELQSGQHQLFKWEQFFHRAEQTLALCQQCELPFSLSICNLPKQTEATEVSAAGIEEWLRKYSRTSDLLGEMGEQEWIILSVEQSPQSAETVTGRLLSRVREGRAECPGLDLLQLGVATEADSENCRFDQIVGMARQRLQH